MVAETLKIKSGQNMVVVAVNCSGYAIAVVNGWSQLALYSFHSFQTGSE